jgi:hypothetical protein
MSSDPLRITTVFAIPHVALRYLFPFPHRDHFPCAHTEANHVTSLYPEPLLVVRAHDSDVKPKAQPGGASHRKGDLFPVEKLMAEMPSYPDKG